MKLLYMCNFYQIFIKHYQPQWFKNRDDFSANSLWLLVKIYSLENFVSKRILMTMYIDAINATHLDL